MVLFRSFFGNLKKFFEKDLKFSEKVKSFFKKDR